MTVHLQLGAAQAHLEGLTARVFAGRDPQACQLSHSDPTLSRRHAEIFMENGQTFIRDLGSANGTWVDGQHLEQQAMPLRPGQQVWLGHVPLGVWCGTEDMFYEDVRALVGQLPTEPEVVSFSTGRHTRFFWNDHTVDAFRLLSRHLHA